ncbi:MAG: class I tRNA ligase family protein, partial [Janthinobacterium lividum]
KGLGKGKVNFRLRDAIFGRQRYWGEPIPIYYKDGTAYGVAEAHLPLVLPEIDEYKPTETGEPPLGRAQAWKYKGQYEFELSTMPGWAGSSWYYLRYMDPHNTDHFVSEEAEQYWGQVDLYMGGAEHATGHLLYSRFWYLFLKDLGLVTHSEPFQKLINQGMILGMSEFTIVSNSASNLHLLFRGPGNMMYDSGDAVYTLYSADYFSNLDEALKNPNLHISLKHADVSFVNNGKLDIEEFVKWRPEYKNAVFVCTNGFWQNGKFNFFSNAKGTSTDFLTKQEVEKMSKSKYNVVNPDVLIDKYGADALRLYEMFLGPLEQFKPWNTNGISGVASFLKKFWRLFHPEDGALAVTDEAASPAELKTLHRVIQKVAQDVEKFSFNTSVSTFMIAVNELTALGTRKRAILEPLVLLLSPYAPHLAEELWEELGHESGSISRAAYPEFREEYLVEANVTYPVAINGKVRDQRQFAATATAAEIEAAILESDFLSRFGEGKAARKVVVVPGRMVNVVV